MVYLGKRCCISKKQTKKLIASCDWKNSKVWPLLSGEMRHTDTVKVHFAKIFEKQKTWTFKIKNYFETLRKVPV